MYCVSAGCFVDDFDCTASFECWLLQFDVLCDSVPCQLHVQAADVLVDEGTKAEACQVLATAVTGGRCDMHWPWRVQSTAADSAQVHIPP